jgi:hypothetical protein
MAVQLFERRFKEETRRNKRARTQVAGGTISALAALLLTSKQWDDELRSQGEEVDGIWDGRVREKPERQKAQAFCVVRSRKLARQKKTSKGAYHPGGRPVVG